jgi:hypothetical protein
VANLRGSLTPTSPSPTHVTAGNTLFEAVSKAMAQFADAYWKVPGQWVRHCGLIETRKKKSKHGKENLGGRQ